MFRYIFTVTINLDSIQQDVLAVGSEHPSVLLYSTLSGDCLARLEGHTKRLSKYNVIIDFTFQHL